MSEKPWCLEIEGPDADARPPAYWIAVYLELERTLSGLVLEKPEAASRLWEVRRRLHHWEAESRRRPEPPTGAADSGLELLDVN